MSLEDNPLLNRPQSGGQGSGQAGAAGGHGVPSAGSPSAKPTTEREASGRAASGGPVGQPGKLQGKGRPGSGSARDILEAVILALVLAFTFRTFMVEAYVIPTGSMAPTLNGAHFRVICPECGWVFDANANVEQQWVTQYNPALGQTQQGLANMPNGELTDPYAIPAPRYITCPNCHFPIPVTSLPDQPVIRRQVQVQNGWRSLYFPYACNGDRILVMKYLYWFDPPKRWDIVVFKEPLRGQQNYIKRLVGLPHNTVEIIGGQVFINGQIAHKPPTVEKAMLQLVYDNDFYPHDAGQPRGNGRIWTNPWVAVSQTPYGGKWNTRGPVIRFAATSPGRQGRLAFIQRGQYLLNGEGYDATFRRHQENHLDGDLYLSTVWQSTSPSSAISMVMGMRSNRYKVMVAHDGQLHLYRWLPAEKQFAAVAVARQGWVKKLHPLQPGHAYQFSMSNIDHQIRFWDDRRLVLQYTGVWTAAQALKFRDYQIEYGREIPRIFVDVTGVCELRHLNLMRDIYYTQTHVEDSQGNDLGPGTATAGHPLKLGSGQYFMMGDNSAYSADGRVWDRVDPALADLHLHRGVVPRRYILGKAFMVYWPAGFRLFDGHGWPLIPNVGKMRLIR